MQVQQRYPCLTLPAAGIYPLPNNAISIASYICVTTGTITVTKANGDVCINAFPAVAGNVYHFFTLCAGGTGGLGSNGAPTVTIGAGGSGTITYDS